MGIGLGLWSHSRWNFFPQEQSFQPPVGLLITIPPILSQGHLADGGEASIDISSWLSRRHILIPSQRPGLCSSPTRKHSRAGQPFRWKRRKNSPRTISTFTVGNAFQNGSRCSVVSLLSSR